MIDYNIIFKKEYEKLDDKEYAELVCDFEDKFLKFKKDLCQDFTLLDVAIEYSTKYDIDIRIISELIQSSKLLSQIFKDFGSKQPNSDNNIW